jgi:hypothetical protein
MEDVRDPTGKLAQVDVGHVGHEGRNAGVLQTGPVPGAAAAGQPEDLVPGGQGTGDGETHAPRGPGHEHPPAGRVRRCDVGHAAA